MMIVSDWLRQAEARLHKAGVDSPRLDAQMLASHVLLVDRPWILAHPEAEINELAAERLLQRREHREPLAYILGWREFYGRRFAVRPGVLIPRQETETLIEAAMSQAKDGAKMLDLGTGSGCIAITLKLERPDLQVTATDISPQALAIAQENAENLAAEITFLQVHGFHGLEPTSFDLIVSNPPYIRATEELMPEVAEYEPAEALYAGSTGLEFYEYLSRQAGQQLTNDGALLVEVGAGQADPVCGIFEEGGWQIVKTYLDLSGHTRVIGARPPFQPGGA